MKILYYDCFAGISGDMNLGAMMDLGVKPEYIISELQKLPLEGYEFEISRKIKMGIEGTYVNVKLTAGASRVGNKKPKIMDLKLGKESAGSIPMIQNNQMENRNYLQIKSMIECSGLNERVKEISQDIFYRIAVAEAKIHGIPVDEIHFHEVGAVDSIVDIVGAAICLDNLNPDLVISSPVQLGSGFVKCAHGTFPVPAPATAEILKGIPVKTGGTESESTTPTGAAILASICHHFTSKHEFIPLKIGYGIGHKDFVIPNVLRVFWSDAPDDQGYITTSARIIECNVDDMPGERFGFIMDKLLENGAEDVYFEPLIMKKSRPAYKLSVLVPEQLINQSLDIIFQESTTLGVRIIEVEKKMLSRRIEEVETCWGKVRVKYGMLNGKYLKAKPEYEDCRKVAQAHNIPFQRVYEEVMKSVDF